MHAFLSLVLAGLLTLPATLLAALPAIGPARGAERATVTVWPDAVDVETGDTYLELSLAVSAPDGTVSHFTKETVDRLSFGLVDDEGEPRPDGLYGYELRGVDAERGSVVLGSGFVSISAGAFLDPDVPERGLEKEYLDDDFYLNGSLCVGDDCQDGSAFGVIDLRIAENNIQLLFDDTSVGPGFSANDWMLRANESASGGAGLFSIVDCGTAGTDCYWEGAQLTILAGAPENSLFIDSSGEVGFGTSVPSQDIHIQNGDTPTVRLGQDSSGGWPAQTWDIGANDANFFIRDMSQGGGVLPFRIEPGAPADSLTIEKTGEVGLGTWDPTATLDVRGSVAVTGTVDGRDVGDDGATLDAHLADVANPHQVTAAQVGADPAGTAATEAAAAVGAHETAYDHGPLAAKAGKLWAGSFSGNPAMASVTFGTPFPSGTNYIVLLTGNTNTDSKAFQASVRVQNNQGFTVTLGGSSSSLNFVGWLAYPLN